MEIKIKKVPETGFCFGVRRAIDMLEKAAQEHGNIDTLGALVHNEQVIQRLKSHGISIINSLDEIRSKVVAISAHGVSPEVEAELKRHNVVIIDTTCPSVKHAQKAAQKLAKEGIFVVVFGEAQHPEVKGILGWTQGKGMAALDLKPIKELEKIPRRLGILSQTTQVPEVFTQFIKEAIDLVLSQNTEIHIIDTICQGVRKRQSSSLELARQVDLMIVIGGATSSNSKRLLELCSTVTESRLIGNAAAIKTEWLQGKKTVGVTSGTSTADQTIEEVINHLHILSGS